MQQSLTIDFSTEINREALLPSGPLLSSHKAGWESIYLEYHRQPPHTIPEHSLEQDLVCICLGRSVTVERVFDGQFRTEYLTAGSCTIIPAQIQHQASCDSDTEFMLLGLDPIVLDRATDESSIELMLQLSISDPLIYQLGLALKTELQSDELGSRFYADAMVHALAVHLTRHYTAQKQKTANYTGGLPKYKLRQVVDYITNNLSQEISLANLAAEVEMSIFHFARSFKQSTGMSPHQFVTQLRINKAKQLLANQNLEIIDIGQELGFKTQSHFTVVFRKILGISPKVYRDSL